MFKEMRRKDKKMNDDMAMEILNNNTYGTLSTIGENGYPYGVPISYVFVNDSIYFHSATTGHKLENISANNKVSFNVVGMTNTLAAEFNSEYESVIAFGIANEVFDQEKDMALSELLNKYSKDYIKEGREYINSSGKDTKVIKINIEHITGKIHKKKS